MIKRPTVLILGAGSSVHCGYPLGHELIKGVAGSILISNTVVTGLGNTLPSEAGFSGDEIYEFALRLSQSGYYSIDEFLSNNQDVMRIGKYLIAKGLKCLESPQSLFPPRDSGWYQYLFNAMLVDGRPDFEENKLSIVTFNYDRSLEAYLYHAIKARFRMSDEQAAERLAAIPILHPHGILGKFPDTPYLPASGPEELLAAANEIKIISEIEDCGEGFCNSSFEAAHHLLKKAERIFFLGFGFHKDNVRRFKFFTKDSLEGKDVFTTRADFSSRYPQRMGDRLSEFGLKSSLFYDNYGKCDTLFHNVTGLDE